MASLSFILSFEEVPNSLGSLGSLIQEHEKEGFVVSKKSSETTDNKKEATAQEPVKSVEATSNKNKEVPEAVRQPTPPAVVGEERQKPPRLAPNPVSSSANGISNNAVGARPPSPSYAGPGRRVGGGVPSRPGSAPLHKSPGEQVPTQPAAEGPAVITDNASYVERWMRNLYSRQETKRQQMASQGSSNGAVGMGRTQTDPVLSEVDRNSLPPTGGVKRSNTPGGFGNSSSSMMGSSNSVATTGGTSGVYRPPRGGSASRFRSDVSGMKPLPSQTSYVLPGASTRQARHRQAVAETLQDQD